MSDLVTPLNQLKVQIWADGADKAGIIALDKDPLIMGFTTNPSLMAKVGITDYPAFAKGLLSAVTAKPISFEVFSEDLADMERQARLIATWGKNVYTKIPITNTRGESCIPLIRTLAHEGVKLNVTALLTLKQVVATADALRGGAPAVVSVFAGRIADTGRDPVPYMRACAAILEDAPNAALLWASTRELLNIYQAEETGCGVITVPHDILKKLGGVNKGLAETSLDTVKGFGKDSTAAGFVL
jgi:transaldolase